MTNFTERHVYIKFYPRLGGKCYKTSRALKVAFGMQVMGRTQVSG
jgi:hypothetical protein